MNNLHKVNRRSGFWPALLLVFLLFPDNSVAQGILITKAGDTIRYIKIEDTYPISKYWVEGSEKPVKIKMEDVKSRIDQPKYTLDKDEVDNFTGSIDRITQSIAIGVSGQQVGPYSMNLNVGIIKSVSKERTIHGLKLWTPIDLGCGGAKDNYIMIKFKDKEVIKLENDLAPVSCKAGATSGYNLDEAILNKLRTAEISGIRFKQSKGYQDFDIIFPEGIIKLIELIDK